MKIGFIGAGRMAGAFAKGLLADGFDAADMGCMSGSGVSAQALASETGISLFESAEALVTSSDAVVLALKPFQLADLPEALNELSSGKVIISMLAGVRLEKLKKQFPQARNWVRFMPNTPSQIGRGVTGISYAETPSPEDRALIDAMLAAVGATVEISEDQMDALTAVSGSGVAYVFEWAAAMIASAEKLGLSPEDAKALTLGTFSGASALMESAEAPAPDALRDAVVSKGGTTEAALNVFAANDQRAVIHQAMSAAAERSYELSK